MNRHLDIFDFGHQDAHMRTTLTLEDDLARRLKEIAKANDQNFKQVVNEAIRRGLSLGELPSMEQEPFVVKARRCGFRTGIDPTKLNQLYDDLEMEDLRGEGGHGVHEP